ncbi:MAG: extracellular solute-binding protein [Lachnospiraceae bacterium]|nr:extracellular solute-binding protein [Lachnospiraceae bacterium]
MQTVKKIFAMILTVALVVCAAGCGKGEMSAETGNTQEPKKEYTYVPEYITIDTENANFYSARISGDSIFYTAYQWDEATQTGTETLIQYSVSEQKVVKEIPFGGEGNRGINTFCVTGDGLLYTVENVYSEDYTDNKIYLCCYDAQGSLIAEQDITEVIQRDEQNSYVDAIAMDAENRIYMACSNLIRLFDSEGNFQGEIASTDNWINAIVTGKDGKVYCTYYDSMAANNSYCLAEIDFTGKKLGTVYKNFPSGNGNDGINNGLEKDFLTSNDTAVYEYDLATQTYEKLFDWLDCDINGTYVQKISTTKDGKILALIESWEDMSCEIAILEKKKTSEVLQKTEVVIGALSTSQELQAAAVNFNKNNDQYHITIKEYLDDMNWDEDAYRDAINRLNNDLISGSSCPDIIDLSVVNTELLAQKGILADLTPYLEKSSVISKEDYLEQVLQGYTYQEKLVGIPKTFHLQTVAGKAADVGEEPGWTLDEVISYAEAHPDAMLLQGATKSQILQILFRYSQDDYIDWETGKCNFESDEFKKLLTFVESFPDQYDWEADSRSTPVMIQDGDLLLEIVHIDDFQSIQMYDAMFGEDVTFVGYPTGDGENGCMLYASGAYAITQKASDKDGAWAFIESYLTEDAGNWFSWGFPTQKALLDEKIESALKVEYATDENGELILDENGEPISLNSGGGISYGDWEFTYHQVTEEEVDTVLALIESSQLVSFYNDEITNIILEDAEPFFKGQKPVEEVTAIIQSRVQLYINENQ